MHIFYESPPDTGGDIGGMVPSPEDLVRATEAFVPAAQGETLRIA